MPASPRALLNQAYTCKSIALKFLLSDQELMASVQHIHTLDRDIPLHGQSWGQMNETVMNSGLWNMCAEDGKISGKKQQLVRDAAFVTVRCGLRVSGWMLGISDSPAKASRALRGTGPTLWGSCYPLPSLDF